MKLQEYKFVPKIGKAKVSVKILHVRVGKPGYTDVSKARSVKKGEVLQYIGYVLDGEAFEENTKWYLDTQGNFYWSGGVRDIKKKQISVKTPTSFAWPLKKDFQRISQPFGVLWSANTKKQHTGTDIAVPAGEKVYAVTPGKVVAIGNLDVQGKWAQYIVLEHTDYCTAYLHINPSSKIKKGRLVKKKDIIGSIASISGTHLHFNVWRGRYNKIVVRGALPLPEHKGKIYPESDPEFPSNFINPESLNYSDIG